MDYSKHPIYSADYISALLIAVALTIFFASAIRERNYASWGQVPPKVWFAAAGSWVCGFIIMWLGAFISRWLPLVFGAVSLCFIVFAMIGAAIRVTPSERAVPTAFRPALALYFCATTAILVATIVARSFVASIT